MHKWCNTLVQGVSEKIMKARSYSSPSSAWVSFLPFFCVGDSFLPLFCLGDSFLANFQGPLSLPSNFLTLMKKCALQDIFPLCLDHLMQGSSTYLLQGAGAQMLQGASTHLVQGVGIHLLQGVGTPKKAIRIEFIAHF